MTDFYTQYRPPAQRSSAPRVPDGQPTWFRVHHGAGCALPRRMADGTLGVLPAAVPAYLQRDPHLDAEYGAEVWRVPQSAWSPGDRVEIGPLPDGVVVVPEIPRPFLSGLVQVGGQ